jgi:hypothetical protein
VNVPDLNIFNIKTLQQKKQKKQKTKNKKKEGKGGKQRTLCSQTGFIAGFHPTMSPSREEEKSNRAFPTYTRLVTEPSCFIPVLMCLPVSNSHTFTLWSAGELNLESERKGGKVAGEQEIEKEKERRREGFLKWG